MIRRIEALNYRSLRYVSQPIRRFQTLVGPNGAGKSNLLDAVGILRDTLHGGPLKAVQGNGSGSPPRAPSARHLCWMRHGDGFEIALEFELPASVRTSLAPKDFDVARYEVAFALRDEANEFGISGERLWLLAPRTAPQAELDLAASRVRTIPSTLQESVGKSAILQRPVIIAKPAMTIYQGEVQGELMPLNLGPSKSALANLPDDEQMFPAATWVRRALLAGVQRIALHSEAMRRPSPAGTGLRLLADGSNLAWIAHELRRKQPETFDRWVAHVRTAIPELQDVITHDRAEDNAKYIALKLSNGLETPSWLVSDGTLRLLVLTILPYLDAPDAIYLIEEPENGLNPRNIEVVMQSLTSVDNAQVLCTSHSPVVLRLLQPSQILCVTKDADGATHVVSGDEHPRLREWQGEPDLGDVFASGILG